MIKVETLGQIENSVNNPVLTSVSDVTLYDFITVDGVTYLVANDLTGDDAYKDEVVIKAGEYIKGYDLAPWLNQKLIVDEKHIAYGSGEDYDDITAGTTLLKISSGKLILTSSAPSSGYYFKVTAKCRLTEKAIEVVILQA